MDIPLRKVTARVDLKAGNAYAHRQPRSRPTSPTKQSPTSSLSPSSFRPKAKVNSAATVRKLSSSSSLGASHTNNVFAPSRSRPASPLRPSRTLTNESEPNGSPKARITARPIQTNLGNLEPRQRALTSAPAKLKLPHIEDRPRSGSVVALHHALSVSDLNAPPSPTSSQPSSSVEPPFIDLGGTVTPPLLAPIKIKSKVTGLVKAGPPSTNAGNLASRSLSPPYATTRPIHARVRTPSVSSSFSLNDPPPTVFYPITTASPAANPHRFVSRRAPSPAHLFPLPTLSSEPHTAKKLPLLPKVDPASVPLPPHSPPISALSLSSKSSVSKTSPSANIDQSTDGHIKRRGSERNGHANPFLPQAETILQPRRDRIRSREGSPHSVVHRSESDGESEGSERQLRAEAKTNRKIADLEITNHSLLAINASLETTRNRQAKEIRDLRRKLRESRLILPPRTYKAVKSALEEERDRDDDEEDDDDSNVEGGADEAFQRVRTLIDSLIESGKRALEMRPEHVRVSLATKVLNADELRSWRGSGQRTSMGAGYTDKQDADDETIHSHPSPALIAVPDSDSTSSMEIDGKLTSDSRGSSVLPPITITHSL